MCSEILLEGKGHKCGEPWCAVCNSLHSPFSRCFVLGRTKVEDVESSSPTARSFILGRKKAEDVEWRSIWYGDTETYTTGATREHVANLVVLERQRKDGGLDRKEYTGRDAMKDFVKDCMKKNSLFKNSYIVWHNACAFDGHLWYRELVKASTPPKEFIVKEQSIISMKMRQNNIVLRDFLQFVPNTPPLSTTGYV